MTTNFWVIRRWMCGWKGNQRFGLPNGRVTEPISVDSELGIPLSSDEADQNARVLVKRPDQRAELVFEMLFEQSEHPIRMSPRTDEVRSGEALDVENKPSIWEP